MRTLVVEDDFTCRLFLQAFLSRYGECHAVVNGREAVDAFRMAQQTGKNYDLICIDIMMPEMDGQTALKHIRDLEEADGTLSSSGAKVIMITALDDPKNVFSAFKSLCDAYVFKPVDTAHLIEQLKSLQLVA